MACSGGSGQCCSKGQTPARLWPVGPVSTRPGGLPHQVHSLKHNPGLHLRPRHPGADPSQPCSQLTLGVHVAKTLVISVNYRHFALRFCTRPPLSPQTVTLSEPAPRGRSALACVPWGDPARRPHRAAGLAPALGPGGLWAGPLPGLPSRGLGTALPGGLGTVLVGLRGWGALWSVTPTFPSVLLHGGADSAVHLHSF